MTAQEEFDQIKKTLPNPRYGEATVIYWGGLRWNVKTGSLRQIIEEIEQEIAMQEMD